MNDIREKSDTDATYNNSQNETPFCWGIGFFICGIAVSSISFFVEALKLDYEKQLSWSGNLLNSINWLVETLNEIGIALIILAVFSIIIETRAWKEYFGKRLSDIMVEQKFLNNLKPEQLANFQNNLLKAYFQDKNLNNQVGERLSDVVIEQRFINTLDSSQLEKLQANTLKAQFKNENITREGSFSKYCIDNVQEYINLPYRENVDIMIRVNDKNPDKSIFEMEDDIVYYCRKTKEAIQEKIHWVADPKEIVSLNKLEIHLRHESISFDSSKHLSCTPSGHVVVGQLEEGMEEPRGRLIVTNNKADGQIICECDISEYKDKDNLEVVVKSKYLLKRGNLQYRRMRYPTNQLTITIKYPEEADLEYKVFGVDDKQVSAEVGKGFFWAKSISWMLPYSGIAWTIREVSKTEHVVGESKQETLPFVTTSGNNTQSEEVLSSNK
jgi:hypothetical protein